MDPNTEGVLLLLLGIFLGAVPVLAWHASERQLRGPRRGAGPLLTAARGGREEPAGPAADVVPPGVGSVLNVLRSSALVVDADDRVVSASAPAYSLGLVRDGELRNDELAELVTKVRRDGEIRQVDLDIHRPGQQTVHVNARVAALSSRLVLVLTEDRTRERRVDAIRRDFVANVSHELKTPVGALTLLAEAVREASDDPEAVQRFAARMQTEAVRLNRLVQQIIELSRLQGDEALERPQMVAVDRVVERSIDFNEIEAKAKGIAVVYDGRRGLSVRGNPDQVSLAVSNLVANAIAYSPEGSRVVVSALQVDLMVDLTVTDEGIGIPRAELDRIFERFYRVDPARHRSTGGTGLGLSIVKHVAATHGGEVKVWSEPGRGSSFTLRLPRHTSTPAPEPPETPDSPATPEKESS